MASTSTAGNFPAPGDIRRGRGAHPAEWDVGRKALGAPLQNVGEHWDCLTATFFFAQPNHFPRFPPTSNPVNPVPPARIFIFASSET
ncbi:hypothetical protein VTI74DRAFT_6251 [Chaetomium olivicolor]